MKRHIYNRYISNPFSRTLKAFLLLLFLAGWGQAAAQWNTDRIMTIGRNALYFEDYVLSIQYFNRVISVKPYLAEPYMYRGMAKAQLGDYQDARISDGTGMYGTYYEGHRGRTLLITGNNPEAYTPQNVQPSYSENITLDYANRSSASPVRCVRYGEEPSANQTDEN